MRFRDRLAEYDERTLPVALRSGDSLAFVRGPLTRYQKLKPFRRVSVWGLWWRQEELTEKAQDAVGPQVAEHQENRAERSDQARLLQQLLERLEHKDPKK